MTYATFHATEHSKLSLSPGSGGRAAADEKMLAVMLQARVGLCFVVLRIIESPVSRRCVTSLSVNSRCKRRTILKRLKRQKRREESCLRIW